MESIECQIIEGGCGDFIMVGGKGKPSLTCETRVGPDGKQLYYEKGGKPVTRDRGRYNWWGRDPAWKDVLGFRGKDDVEKPAGEWNRMEVICDGDSITNIVNGYVVNVGTKSSLTKGKILFQSEGAEILFRKIEVRPHPQDGRAGRRRLSASPEDIIVESRSPVLEFLGDRADSLPARRRDRMMGSIPSPFGGSATPCPARPGGSSLLAASAVAVAAPPARADDDPAVARGVQYLKARAGSGGVGETALMALAMIKAEVPPDRPGGGRRRGPASERSSPPPATPPSGPAGTTSTRPPWSPWSWPTATPRPAAADLETVARYLIGQQKAERVLGLRPPRAGDTLDLAVRRPRPLGGRERRGPRAPGGLGPRRVVVPLGPEPRRELELPPRRDVGDRRRRSR